MGFFIVTTMYLFLLLSALYVNVKTEACTGPSGQSGECVPIRSCPSLMWSIANVKYTMQEYVDKHVCTNNEFGLTVCCYEPRDYLIFENYEHSTYINSINDIKLSNSKECGITDNSVVRNGMIRLQDFPWLVKIVSTINEDKEDPEKKVVCTGVLINEWYVLLAAQCYYYVTLIGTGYFIQVESYKPKENDCDSRSYSQNCSYFETYEGYHDMHKFYDQETILNDIGIIRLNRRIHKSDYLRPVCLPLSDTLEVGQTLQIASWNRTFDVDDISVKKIQSSVVISNDDCQKIMSQNGTNISLTVYEFCTETVESVIDKYDFFLPIMSLRGNQWYIEGFGSQGYYGYSYKINTRIHNYLHWMQSRMGFERCLTPYNETGEGTELGFCPRLMDAIANAHSNDTYNLLLFFGKWSSATPKFTTYVFLVCCGLTPNFTLPPETIDKRLDLQISNFKYCGLQHRDDYISSDDRISIDEFPWLAAIMNATLIRQRVNLCSGTLISDRYVLTSGRCNKHFNSFDTLIVRFGDYNQRIVNDCVQVTALNVTECSDINEYTVEKRIPHPFYNYVTYLNNIALLRLNTRVTFSDFVRPICLPRSENDLGVPGDTLFSTGFGDAKKEFAGPKIKKKVRMKLISTEECKDKLRPSSTRPSITPYHICSKNYKNSTDILCSGDEGGPVMISKRSRWFVAGISSLYVCGDSIPQIHLNVYKYMKWIKLNIE